MAFHAGRQCLPAIVRRGKLGLGWGGTLAVGIATLSIKTISSHVACGNIRSRYLPHGLAQLNSAFRPFSTYLPQNQLLSSLFSSNVNKMSVPPPQAPLQWNHSAEDITRLTKDAVENYRKVMDSVGGLDAKDCTFESVSL